MVANHTMYQQLSIAAYKATQASQEIQGMSVDTSQHYNSCFVFLH